ncbi:MAG: hypothetical protein J6J41_05685 [Clostridia bacterium]|nr:hypothetical protein [Clostridia bacterium]
MEALVKARGLLAEVTPLKRDCGRICGKRCCSSLEGEETGMLLFPEEEDYYGELEGWRMLPAGRELLLICPGSCRREERPLACRMFPLLPIPTAEGIAVRTDERARAVCPLARQGVKGMDPAFAEAVRQAGEILAGDEKQREFLNRLAEEQEELKALRKRLNPKGQ